MIQKVRELLDEADIVVHYYGSRFDLPILNREFLLHGLPPPAPYKSIDLCNTVRRKFKFISNKLDHVCQRLGLGKKHDTDFKLWIDCMNKDPKAWELMMEYNVQDVLLLEGLYEKIKAWIPNHPNVGLYKEDALVCPTCGGGHYQKRGEYHTNAGIYQRYQCQAVNCGRWFRGIKNQGPKLGERFAAISS